MRDESFQNYLLYVVIRAIETEGTYYFFENLRIDKEITNVLDELSGQLFDLVDEHLDARDIGDLDLSNEALSKIWNDDILRALSSYHLDPGVKGASSAAMMLLLNRLALAT